MMRASIAGVMLALTLALPAQAHTIAELDEWMEQWGEEASNGLSLGLMARLDAQMTRHPWYYSDEDASGEVNPPSGRGAEVAWSVGAGTEQWRSLVATYFPVGEVDRALCIMGFESGGDPGVISYANSHGLMQVHAPSWAGFYGVTWAALLDPVTNVQIAADIFLHQGGWVHWNPWQRGECR